MLRLTSASLNAGAPFGQMQKWFDQNHTKRSTNPTSAPTVVILAKLYKSIDVRRWHREGRLLASRQFSWSWTSGGETSGTIKVRSEVDAVVLMYQARSFLAAGGNRSTSECRLHGRCVISEADALGVSVPSVATHNTAGGGWPCCTSPENRSRAESAIGWLMPASRAGYCFATFARRRALGCGSAAIRTPVSRFPPSPAACIGGRICCFGRRQRRLKR